MDLQCSPPSAPHFGQCLLLVLDIDRRCAKRQLVDGCPHVLDVQVAIDLGRDPWVGVPQEPLHGGEGDPSFQQQGGVGGPFVFTVWRKRRKRDQAGSY